MLAEVVFLPPLATELHTRLCVVIDVLRATSTLVSIFEAGARRVLLSESIPAALVRAAVLSERPLVCGESGGVRPEGFDFGNSPREFPPGSLKGKVMVMCTSNGTKAMGLVASAPVVLAGSLLNGSAVARAAVREARERSLNIALVCSGDHLGTRFALDDAFCAGYLVTLLQREAASPASHDQRSAAPREAERETLELEESAVAALRLYRSYLVEAGASDPKDTPPRSAILRAFWESRNAQLLRRVGLADDVEYCSQLDISARVPRLRVEGTTLELVDNG